VDENYMTPEGYYPLTTAGAREDLERLGLTLVAGLSVTVYYLDHDADDRPVTFSADAVVEVLPPWGFVARPLSPFTAAKAPAVDGT
jgi:hypothetical protein